MKKISYILMGVILGVGIIVSTNSIYANSQEVLAKFSAFNFVVNGEKKELEADPLVYQGTTYLPVRVVSNMLGYDVTYKADSRTIELNNGKKQTPNYQYENSNQQNSLNESEWVPLRELAEVHSELNIYLDGNTNPPSLTMSNGERTLTIPIPNNMIENHIYHIVTENNKVRFKMQSGMTLLNVYDLHAIHFLN